MSTGVDPSNLRTYTDAELITLYRWALANGAAGQTRTIAGRSVSFPSAPDMLKVLAVFEARQQATLTGDGVSVVTFEDGV